MLRDYQSWYKLKSAIEARNHSPYFGQQEIWWCSLGANVGSESDGKNQLFERPILVLRKFNMHMFWGLPMTSQKKQGIFYYSFPLHDIERTVMLSQVRVLSAKRLIRRIGKISDNLFGQLYKQFIGLTKTAPLREPRGPNGHL